MYNLDPSIILQPLISVCKLTFSNHQSGFQILHCPFAFLPVSARLHLCLFCLTLAVFTGWLTEKLIEGLKSPDTSLMLPDLLSMADPFGSSMDDTRDGNSFRWLSLSMCFSFTKAKLNTVLFSETTDIFDFLLFNDNQASPWIICNSFQFCLFATWNLTWFVNVVKSTHKRLGQQVE